MIKTAYFASEIIDGWPTPEEIERYFLAPPGKEWFEVRGNDTADFQADGADDTEHLELGKGRIIVRLALWGIPGLGVMLMWSKKGGGHKESYMSKGDFTRLREYVRTSHNDPMPVGLFVPFPLAWEGVKEFLNNEGARPKSIEWIANRDLPLDTFPNPRSSAGRK